MGFFDNLKPNLYAQNKRVNLTIDPNHTRAGFLTIGPFVENGEDKVQGDISNIDQFLDNGEVEELLCYDAVTFFDQTIVPKMLDNLAGKISIGGVLTLGFPDIYGIAKAIASHSLDLATFNHLIYGNGVFRKSALTIEHIVKFFEERNFKTLLKRSENGFCVTRFERKP